MLGTHNNGTQIDHYGGSKKIVPRGSKNEFRNFLFFSIIISKYSAFCFVCKYISPYSEIFDHARNRELNHEHQHDAYFQYFLEFTLKVHIH